MFLGHKYCDSIRSDKKYVNFIKIPTVVLLNPDRQSITGKCILFMEIDSQDIVPPGKGVWYGIEWN